LKPSPVPRKHRRLPGEIAFDRCFLPLVAVIVLQMVYTAFLWVPMMGSSEGLTEEEVAAAIPPPLWHAWFWFTIGLLLAILWFRAIITLARAWRDPSSRVIRFAACVVLIPFAAVTCGLLLNPLR
jgi:hypothetical protein